MTLEEILELLTSKKFFDFAAIFSDKNVKLPNGYRVLLSLASGDYGLKITENAEFLFLYSTSCISQSYLL